MTLDELRRLNEARAETKALRDQLADATSALTTATQEIENLQRHIDAARLSHLPSPFEVFTGRVFIDARGILVRLPK